MKCYRFLVDCNKQYMGVYDMGAIPKTGTISPEQKDPQEKNLFQKIWTWEIGVIPLPLYTVLAVIIILSAYYNELPANMLGGFAIIMILGVFLGDIGQRIPILKDIGGPAILSLFVPSFLVFYNVLKKRFCYHLCCLNEKAWR